MKFQPPRGTRDLPPAEARKREKIIAICRRIYEKYGFEPLETPAFEDWKLLAAKSSGEEIKKEIYYFKDKSQRELGLRFDLTVPACRFIANNPEIPKPFRRYQIGRVWRYDRPGASRWREFRQADVDIFGSASPLADSETVLAVCEVLKELRIEFTVRINSRIIVEDFLNTLGIKDAEEVFRSIDKLEKIGKEGVRKELEKSKIENGTIKKILDFIATRNEEKILSSLGKKGKEAFEDLKIIQRTVSNSGYSTIIDMSLVRGLAYYTGPVFEISAKKGPSIAGGGRFDLLVEKYGGPKTPATGISLGIDRISELLPAEEPLTKIFVAAVNEKVKGKCIEIAQKVRSLGIPCEYDIMGRSLNKQFYYINSKKIPYAIVVGEKEIALRKYKLRDMKSGEEELLDENEFEKLRYKVASLS